jgi:hypothetical protein
MWSKIIKPVPDKFNDQIQLHERNCLSFTVTCASIMFLNPTLISNALYYWVLNSVHASAREDRPEICLHHLPLSSRNNVCSRYVAYTRSSHGFIYEN